MHDLSPLFLHGCIRHDGGMFSISCPMCKTHSLATTSRVTAFANTDAGPRALLSCPQGHEVIKDFRSGDTLLARSEDGPLAAAEPAPQTSSTRTLPATGSTSTVSPSSIPTMAPAQPTTAGRSSSRANTAA